MAWFYLFIASLLEIAWTYSVKFLDFRKMASIRWLHFFSDRANFILLMPLLGYIFFGLGNAVCFANAIKQIPPSTALAVWMAVAVIGTKLVDINFFKEAYNFWQVLYILLIITGIIGLNRGTK